MAILSAYRNSALHVLFIGCFTVAILSVATRVVLGHSGDLHLVRRRVVFFAITLLLLIFAMSSRFAADFVPTRNEHLLWGAVSWLLAVASWAAIALPYMTRVEEESE